MEECDMTDQQWLARRFEEQRLIGQNQGGADS
jgi:hypothetical protein